MCVSTKDIIIIARFSADGIRAVYMRCTKKWATAANTSEMAMAVVVVALDSSMARPAWLISGMGWAVCVWH